MMDLQKYLAPESEQPLDRMVTDGGFVGVFRTIACVGDSLSSGEFEATDGDGTRLYLDFFDYSWGQYLARMAGCTVYNFSRGGMTGKEYWESFAESKDYWNPEKKAQAYIIALGVNDILNCKWEVGSVSDICLADENKNAKTFAGYYGAIIQRYQRIAPRAKFFLMTMPRDDKGAERNELMEAHAALLYGIAALLPNCYVLDLHKYGPVYDQAFEHRFYLNGHLNACGYRLTAEMVASYMDYIIRHNIEDFRQVSFIGTPYEFH